jgi:hypothetical protein
MAGDGVVSVPEELDECRGITVCQYTGPQARDHPEVTIATGEFQPKRLFIVAVLFDSSAVLPEAEPYGNRLFAIESSRRFRLARFRFEDEKWTTIESSS